MQTYISRNIEEKVKKYLDIFPVVAILGPRQCGKSTLVKKIGQKIKNFLYLDLESISDYRKLDDPELFLESNPDKVICLDEIQLKPELFPLIRSAVDKQRQNGKLILLGSASGKLLKQSSQSLAGRIGYIELSPFSQSEISGLKNYKLEKHWLRGGYPESFLAKSNENSFIWRENFIKTFFERDIPRLGIKIPSLQLRRFFLMLAHNQGQTLNSSKLAISLGLSHNTIRSYLDILEETFVARTLAPFEANVKKRLVKSPKTYIRDVGVLHRLLEIKDFNSLLGNPIFGYSWEGFAIENILSEVKDWNGYFYRTASGNEIDLVLEKGDKIIAAEFKASKNPILGKGFYLALEDIGASEAWVVIPTTDESFKIAKNITVSGIADFSNYLQNT